MIVKFYQITDESLLDNVVRIVEKIYKNNPDVNGTMIFKSTKLLKEIDKKLWVFSQNCFIPHGTNEDTDHDKQPIFLTDKNENPNQSKIKYVILEKITEMSEIELEPEIEMFVVIVKSNFEKEELKSELMSKIKNEPESIFVYSKNKNVWN